MARNGIAFGRYTLLRKLGSGGMGEVFLARQAGPGGFERLVALKQLLPELSGDDYLRQLFLDEARIAGTLSHPSIAHVYELGEVDSTWFIALEYVFGEDLSRVRARAIDHAGGVPLPYAARIVADLCAGLDYAHKRRDEQGSPMGIVHRDVSPQNVLVSFDGQVKLVDFGIARAMNKAMGAAGQVRGKLNYMAPEQLMPGFDVDGRADVFAAGCVLRELVAEKGEPPPALARAIARATAKRIEDRPFAAELQDMLETYLVQERWRVGQRELTTYMTELFGDRIALFSAAPATAATATVTVEEVLGYLEQARQSGEFAPLPPGVKALAEGFAGPAAPPPPVDDSGGDEPTELSRPPVLEGPTQVSASGPGEARPDEATRRSPVPAGVRARPEDETSVSQAEVRAGEDEPTRLSRSGPRNPPARLTRAPVVVRTAALALLALAGGILTAIGIWRLATGGRSADAARPPVIRVDLGTTPDAGEPPAVVATDPAAGDAAGILAEPGGGGALVMATAPDGGAVGDDGRSGPLDPGLDGEEPVADVVPDKRPKDRPRIGPRPPPPATPAKGFGELTLDSRPWSEVRINNRSLGPTPHAHVRLRAGTYVVDFENPETRQRARRKVTIVAGQETKMLVPLE